MAVPPPWLGLFQDSHIDHDAAQVFVQAGKILTNGLEKTTQFVWKKTEVMTELMMYNDIKSSSSCFAGYSREVAEKLGPTITTVIFVRDGESFVHTISTPSARSICTRRFRLDHEDEVAGVKVLTVPDLTLKSKND